MIKRAFFPLIFATLIAILLVGSVKAVTISVTCTPELIPHLGGTTTITVTSDEGGIGYIKVIQPNGEYSIVGICIPAGGGSVSKDYPDDFGFPSDACTYMEYCENGVTISPPEEDERVKGKLALLLQALVEQQKSMHAGRTRQLGEYRVEVSLFGCVWFKRFWVMPLFFVVPESPLGTIMATAASLGALIGFVTVKRLRTRHCLH